MNKENRLTRIRKLRGFTAKQLGLKVGFSYASADVRIAQYETGYRTPKDETVQLLASALDVAPSYLTIPNFNSLNEVAHFLFDLEDRCGLQANIINNRLCLSFEHFDKVSENIDFIDFLTIWKDKAQAVKEGNLSQEEYDDWRYKLYFEKS